MRTGQRRDTYHFCESEGFSARVEPGSKTFRVLAVAGRRKRIVLLHLLPVDVNLGHRPMGIIVVQRHNDGATGELGRGSGESRPRELDVARVEEARSPGFMDHSGAIWV